MSWRRDGASTLLAPFLGSGTSSSRRLMMVAVTKALLPRRVASARLGFKV